MAAVEAAHWAWVTATAKTAVRPAALQVALAAKLGPAWLEVGLEGARATETLEAV